jgi:2-methylfumaryl-CoA hydratase
VTQTGRFFEDFRVGQELRHAIPRTMNAGDVALYMALTGSRFAVNAADEFARALGFAQAPLDDLLVFHIVFGRSVADVSLNAVANLGYAELRFGVPVFVGDTLSAASTVIGVKENAGKGTGIVWVRTHGVNQRGEMVVEFARWVMLPKREATAPPPAPVVPQFADHVAAPDLLVPANLHLRNYPFDFSGDTRRWGDYQPGQRIDHVAGQTVEEAEHAMATRLYQNPARIHVDKILAAQSRFGQRLVYGGHVMSLARALSFEGLANAFKLVAINGGRHVAPVNAGDTLYAWTEIRDLWPLPGRDDVGALRLVTMATKDQPCGAFPTPPAAGASPVVLIWDYTVLMPR